MSLYSIENTVGGIACATSIIGLLPQVVKTFKTKSAEDLSTIMLVNYLVCSLAWTSYGYYTNSIFVLISNIIGTITSFILMIQKRYYHQRLQSL